MKKWVRKTLEAGFETSISPFGLTFPMLAAMAFGYGGAALLGESGFFFMLQGASMFMLTIMVMEIGINLWKGRKR